MKHVMLISILSKKSTSLAGYAVSQKLLIDCHAHTPEHLPVLPSGRAKEE